MILELRIYSLLQQPVPDAQPAKQNWTQNEQQNIFNHRSVTAQPLNQVQRELNIPNSKTMISLTVIDSVEINILFICLKIIEHLISIKNPKSPKRIHSKQQANRIWRKSLKSKTKEKAKKTDKLKASIKLTLSIW